MPAMSKLSALPPTLSLRSRSALRAVLPMLAVLLLAAAAPAAFAKHHGEKPNILWITSEDNGPHLGCYGDKYAVTPNLDALAKQGMLYKVCWSTAPVCAPARTCILTGMYGPSNGGQHMRSMADLPAQIKGYPEYLRKAGYYTTNNSKTDYNVGVDMSKTWDSSGRKAHWKNRGKGQPFFAVFNHTISHESQIRNKINKADQIHDPSKAPIPAYHPDVEETRKNWAQYYDRITMMDKRAGQNLKELEQAGLHNDTIVFYYGDHGSGMPRSKRWPYNSGLHVPLIVYFPKKWQHLAPKDYAVGGQSDRLVGFVDLAPTVLSLAGVKPPKHMQGLAIAGKHETAPPKYIYGFRGRMDERYDMVRTVRDQRYVYLRHYMPHKVYGQYVAYMFQTHTTRKWKELYDAGKLNAAQSRFWQTKPTEELYDLQADPDEVNNLASDQKHATKLVEMRSALEAHVLKSRDIGFLPEGMFHRRANKAGVTPYEYAQSDKYDLPRILNIANLATAFKEDHKPFLADALKDKDAAVRYWAAIGLMLRGKAGYGAANFVLAEMMASDPSPEVRVAAAESLAKFGHDKDAKKAIATLMHFGDANNADAFVAMYALSVIEDVVAMKGKKAVELGVSADAIAKLPAKHASLRRGGSSYLPNLIKKIVSDLR